MNYGSEKTPSKNNFRSLVLQPSELHNLRVKFSSLCRRQGRYSMSRDILRLSLNYFHLYFYLYRSLLDLDPNAPLTTASVPHEKPMLVRISSLIRNFFSI